MTEPPQPPTNDGSDDPDGDGIDEPVWARPDDAPEPSGETGAGDDFDDTTADAADGGDEVTDAGDAGGSEEEAESGAPVDQPPADESGADPADESGSEPTIDAADAPEEPPAPGDASGVVGEPTAIYPPVAPSFGSANDDVLWDAAASDDAASTTEPSGGDEAAAAGALAASSEAAAPHVEGDHTRQLRRVSHRRYVMRRAGAAVLALALIGGGIFGVLQLTGDDEPTADDNRLGDSVPPDTEPVVIADPTTTVATTVAPTEPTTTTEAAVETEPAPLVPIEAGADTEAPDDDPPVDTEADEAPATEPDDESAVDTEPLAVTTTAETTSTTTPPTTTEEEPVTSTSPPTSEPEAPVEPIGGSESEPPGDEGSEPPAAGSEPADAESIFDDPRRPSGYELDSAPSCELSGGAGLGMAGSDVECIESRLDQVTIGPINFEVDRIFDEDTELAVMWFQYENCLVIDGIVGPQTAMLLGIWPGSAPSADDDDDEDAPEDTGEAPLDTEPECIPGVTTALPGDSEPASTEP